MIKFNKTILDELSKAILAQQSFEYTSFPLAKAAIQNDTFSHIQCVFDRLSLCIYSHNLDADSYSYLERQLTRGFDDTKNSDQRKCRQEYVALFHLFSLHPEYFEMNILKETRPDFHLHDTKKDDIKEIGVEVTRFTTKRDSILAAISKQNFGKGKSATEIRDSAIKKHGGKASEYRYTDANHTPVIGTGMVDTLEIQKIYAGEVVKKYDMYKTKLADYAEFWILCDARYAFCLYNQKDADEIVKLAQHQKPEIHGFKLWILWGNQDGHTVVSEYLL